MQRFLNRLLRFVCLAALPLNLWFLARANTAEQAVTLSLAAAYVVHNLIDAHRGSR